MRFFRDLPIKRKLTIITLLIIAPALLLACAAFGWDEQREFRKTMRQDFSVLTEIFDANVAPGLAFDDPASIEQMLNTLSANPHILAACVYNKDGEIAARYERANL